MESVLTYLALTVAAAVAPNQPVWNLDYGQAYATAQRTGRPLLVVIDQSSDAQRRIEQVSKLADKSEADLLANYTLCHVDAATADGKAVAKAFEAQSFPYLAISDRGAKTIIHQRSGQVTTDQWLATLTTYRTGERQIAIPERSRAICFT